jgi:hypothetical protein
VIYCVVPRELEAELFDRLVAYYADNDAVEVIVDRRSGPNRRSRGKPTQAMLDQRVVRDRRRPRTSGIYAPPETEDA